MRFTKTNFAALLLVFIVSFFIALNYFSYMTIEFDARVVKGKDFKGQVYYSDNGVFSEKDAIYFDYRRTRGWQHVDLELRNVKNITAIRLDPIFGNSGIVDIRNIKLTNIQKDFPIAFDDFVKMDKHSLDIDRLKEEVFRFKITSDDPYVVLGDKLTFSKYSFLSYIYAFISAIAASCLLFIYFFLSRKYNIGAELIASVPLVLYSVYALFFSISFPFVSRELLIVLPLISLLLAYKNGFTGSLKYFKNTGFVFFFYFLLSFLSLYLAPKYADTTFFAYIFPYIFLTIFIPFGYFDFNQKFNHLYFRVFLTVLAVVVGIVVFLLIDHYIDISKEQLLGLQMWNKGWSEKNYAFWYVLLLFGTISFYDARRRTHIIIVLLLLIFSYFVLLNTTSGSAKLAFLVSSMIYIISEIGRARGQRYFYYFAIFISLCFFLTPFIFSFIISSLGGYGLESGRDQIYKTASEFLSHSWLYGYGFGSTETLNLKDFLAPEKLKDFHYFGFPGGHPHSLSLLFWLEFGVIGAILASFAVYKILKTIIDRAYGCHNLSALLAMSVGLLVIISFSWSKFYLAVLLTYAFYAVLVLLSLNQSCSKTKTLESKKSKHKNYMPTLETAETSFGELSIETKYLSKIFHLYDRPIDRMKESLNFFTKRKYHHDFYALKTIDLKIGKGEVVGIIGKNGAGKSTLLKIITGVLTQTSGSVNVNGKIASLLELGAGFNPEMTGHENIYFNGSLMGYTKEEMDGKVEDIISFADIGDFIYQPVKTYSSGMFARLAFAVAINVDPDILIVDEALSVGDAAFQRKCFAKMERFKREDKTIIFVSHSEGQIVELCSRAILMHDGEVVLDGNPKEVTSLYLKFSNSKNVEIASIRQEFNLKQKENIENVDFTTRYNSHSNSFDEFFDATLLPKSSIAYESKGVIIKNIRITNNIGREVNVLNQGREYTYSYEVEFLKKMENVQFGMLIKTINGIELGGGAFPSFTKYIDNIAPGKKQVSWKFKASMNEGVYFTNAGLIAYSGNDLDYSHRLIDAYGFRVMRNNNMSTAYVDFVNECVVEDVV